MILPYARDFGSYNTLTILLYVILGIILLFFILVLYIGYSIKYKQKRPTSIIIITRIFCDLFLSVLYWPMLENVLGPYACRSANG